MPKKIKNTGKLQVKHKEFDLDRSVVVLIVRIFSVLSSFFPETGAAFLSSQLMQDFSNNRSVGTFAASELCNVLRCLTQRKQAEI